MATRMVFLSSGGDGPLTLTVAQELEDVRRMWASAGGSLMELDGEEQGKVFVNARAIAYIESAD